MVSLEQMFKGVYEGVLSGNERYKVLDHQHIMDEQLDVEYHLYAPESGEPFKVTKDDATVITGKQMTTGEAGILDAVRMILYKDATEKNRKYLYELGAGNPKPEVKPVQGGVNGGLQ